jgi:hypothetical protein
MPRQDSKDTARLMIQRHGLQAQAVALEHVQEMRLQGDTAGLDRWQSIYAASASCVAVRRGASVRRRRKTIAHRLERRHPRRPSIA